MKMGETEHGRPEVKSGTGGSGVGGAPVYRPGGRVPRGGQEGGGEREREMRGRARRINVKLQGSQERLPAMKFRRVNQCKEFRQGATCKRFKGVRVRTRRTR